jgi:hypothetical protein
MCVCGGVVEVTLIGMLIAWWKRPWKKKKQHCSECDGEPQDCSGRP